MLKNYFSKKTLASLLASIMLVSFMVVPGSAEEQNTVPAQASVVKQGYMDGSSTSNSGYALVNEYGGLKITSKNTEYVNFGSTAYKIESTTAGNVLNGYSFLYLGNLLNPGVEPERNAWYYASFYVYVPASADIQLRTQNNKTVISKTTVPADTWVKLNGLIDLSTDTKAGYGNWKLEISNTTATVAYVDDIVVAQLSEAPAAASLNVSHSEYDYEGGMKLTLSSNITIDVPSTEDVALTNDANLTSFKVLEDGLTFSVEVDSLKPGTDYELSIANVKDVFGRVSTSVINFSTPKEFEIADISNGELDGEYIFTKEITNNSASDISVGFVVASYNDAGELIDIDMQLKPLSAKGGSEEFTAGVLPGAEYKVFVCNWETLVSLQ